MKQIKNISIIVIVFITMMSCSTKNQIHYLRDASDYNNVAFNNVAFTIQPNDILKIDILTPDYKSPSNVFNLTGDVGLVNINALKLAGYVVSSDFKIKLHILGEIDVKDKTTKQLEDIIEKLLLDQDQLKNPNVNVRIINSKITIQGEVRKPGTYDIIEGKVTIFQALGYAGDLTISGVRDNILVVRQHNGVTQIGRISLKSASLLESPFYYVKQNDYIYVEPNGPKTKSAGYLGSFGSILGTLSALITTFILINNITK